MAELISLKRPKSKSENTKSEGIPVDLASEEYGWGTRLTLDEPEIKALGIDVSKMSADPQK